MINEQYLIELLSERTKIINYVLDNYSVLKSNSDNAEIKKFSTKCDGLGQFYPGIIMYRREKGASKGRFLNKKPDNFSYCIFEMSKNKEPFRIRKFNQFGCDSSYYFYQNNSYHYCVPLRGDTTTPYGRNVYRYSIKDGAITEYAEFDNSTIVLEKYDYNHLSEGYFECHWCYYYNSDFNSISESTFDSLTSSLSEKLKSKINFPLNGNPTIRKSDYYYKIFINGKRIEKIEEYNHNNGAMKYIRNIY